MLDKGCANFGPGSLRVPEMTWTDGPGFSLCAAPLESSGPGFRVVRQRVEERVEVRSIPDWRVMEKTYRE